MSPLMLMLVLSLVPFPVLAIAILADRLLKATQKTVSWWSDASVVDSLMDEGGTDLAEADTHRFRPSNGEYIW